MKAISLFLLSITLLYYTPSVCVQKKRPHKKRARGMELTKPLIIKRTVINYIQNSNFWLKNISPDKSYTLGELRNWFVPLSLVNKEIYAVAQQPQFMRNIISSVACNNDHYYEEAIVHALNTPGARRYQQLSYQLFNAQLSAKEVTALVEKGADMNYRKSLSSEEDTPFIYCIRKKSYQNVKLLLQKGAVRLNHYTRIDPISLSIQMLNSTDTALFTLLMDYANPQDDNLYFPLRYAIQKYTEGVTIDELEKAYKEIIIRLLDKGADATEGLVYAIEQGHFYPVLIKILISCGGADPNEAFIKLVEYALINTKASKEHIEMAVCILKESPQFKTVDNATYLLQRVARINTLKSLIS